MKRHTSQSSPLYVRTIATQPAGPGWIAVTMAPGKKTLGTYVDWHRDLEADLTALVSQEATTLVPLVTDDELSLLHIPGLVATAEAHGLHVLRFPFHDGGIPESMPRTLRFVDELCERLGRGERLVVHCNGGLGRAGTIAACVRLRLGLDADAASAIASVRSLRSERAIETREQERFIGRFAAETGAPGRSADRRVGERRQAPEGTGRRAGAFLGLAVGDALGAPVEFVSAAEIARSHGRVTEMMAGGGWERGEWTDDTALTLAAVEAYGPAGFEPARAAKAMVAWMRADPKDIGNLTRAALSLIAQGQATALEAGRLALELSPGNAGNGSLMRAAPTGLVRAPDDPRLIEESVVLSAVTHADPRCLAACVAFNAALSTLVRGEGEVGGALAAAGQAARGMSDEVDEIVASVRAGQPPRYRNEDGIGFVLVCLERGLVALRDAPSFEDGVVEVVNQGGDSDTNAAVAGCLLGARFGLEAIPRRWLADLHAREVLDAALARLEALAAS